MMEVLDIECNRCHQPYKNTERGMAVLFHHSYFSICPTCTKEVAALMGFTEAELNKQMGLIKEAETENNRKLRIKEGSVCFECHKKFGWDEPRVGEDNASNTPRWHIACYNSKGESSHEDCEACKKT